MREFDLVLSSGFLAFSRHLGFLKAIENSNIKATAVCGTSSGALCASLWAAGMSADNAATLLSERRPSSYLRPRWAFWQGAFSTGPMVELLRQYLPGTFDELPLPFAVGVRNQAGQHELITSGDLPLAVAASCAVPGLFAPVEIAGQKYQDGGTVDRFGLEGWRDQRGERPTLLHCVERSLGKKNPIAFDDVVVVNTPRSGAKLWSLGDFDGQYEEAVSLTQAVISKP